MATGFDLTSFIVSLVLVILLIGHWALMRLAESKDRMVVQALQQHQTELKLVEAAADEQVAPMGMDSASAQAEHHNLSR
jgi:hypothetical protein